MGFNMLFLGILFMFDFRLQNIDILPDFVGYIFIFNGLSALRQRSPNFDAARPLCIPLVVLSLFDIYQFQMGSMGGVFVIYYLISVITAALNLVVFYHICKGIENLAAGIFNLELAAKARVRWGIYLLVTLISPLLTLMGFINLPIVAILGIPLFIISIIALALLMGLMKEAERTFG